MVFASIGIFLDFSFGIIQMEKVEGTHVTYVLDVSKGQSIGFFQNARGKLPLPVKEGVAYLAERIPGMDRFDTLEPLGRYCRRAVTVEFLLDE